MGWTASARATGLDQFKFIVFKDPASDLHRFNFDADIVRADEIDDNYKGAGSIDEAVNCECKAR